MRECLATTRSLFPKRKVRHVFYSTPLNQYLKLQFFVHFIELVDVIVKTIIELGRCNGFLITISEISP